MNMCTSGGYIKIYRSIRDNWVWQDKVYGYCWIDLILLASWSDVEVLSNKKIIKLKRGQAIASESFLAERWELSKKQVRHFMSLLIKSGMISRHIMHGKTAVITICNYDSYQCDGASTGYHTGDSTGYHTGYRTGDTNKEDKEDKEYKEDNNKKGISEDIPKESPTPKIDFQEFINEYHNECQRMPKVLKLSEKRKTKIKCRLSEFSKDQIFEAFKKAGQSNFMNGENNKNWKANFDWIMESENNILKILEGHYDNKVKAISEKQYKMF